VRASATDAYLISNREKGLLNKLNQSSSPYWINCCLQKEQINHGKFFAKFTLNGRMAR
jgi:hypothetical protein